MYTSSARGERSAAPASADECQRFRFYGRLSNSLTYNRDHAYQVSHQMFPSVLIPGPPLGERRDRYLAQLINYLRARFAASGKYLFPPSLVLVPARNGSRNPAERREKDKHSRNSAYRCPNFLRRLTWFALLPSDRSRRTSDSLGNASEHRSRIFRVSSANRHRSTLTLERPAEGRAVPRLRHRAESGAVCDPVGIGEQARAEFGIRVYTCRRRRGSSVPFLLISSADDIGPRRGCSGNLILFEVPPKMPPSALISVHTVGCAWRLLMCYVNTLPKRPGREAFLRTGPTPPPGEPISRRPRPPGEQLEAQGVGRPREINATSNGALSDAAISRLARGKREPPRREVSEFKCRSGRGTRDPIDPNCELPERTLSAVFSAVRKMCAGLARRDRRVHASGQSNGTN